MGIEDQGIKSRGDICRNILFSNMFPWSVCRIFLSNQTDELLAVEWENIG